MTRLEVGRQARALIDPNMQISVSDSAQGAVLLSWEKDACTIDATSATAAARILKACFIVVSFCQSDYRFNSPTLKSFPSPAPKENTKVSG